MRKDLWVLEVAITVPVREASIDRMLARCQQAWEESLPTGVGGATDGLEDGTWGGPLDGAWDGDMLVELVEGEFDLEVDVGLGVAVVTRAHCAGALGTMERQASLCQ